MIFFKNRPFLAGFIFLAGGIITVYYFAFLQIFLIYLFLIILLIFIFKKKKFIILLLVIFIIGTLLITIEERKYNSRDSVTDWQGRENILIKGVISEDLQNLTDYKIYLKPYFINKNAVKYGKIELDKRYLPISLKDGDFISGFFSLKIPARKKNPGGFSYYKYSKEKGIYSIGYFEHDLKVLGRKRNMIKSFIIMIKRKMIALIETSLSSPYSEVVKALLLGERSQLPESWQKNFTFSGANHLLAISGLHIGFIMILLLKLAEYLDFIPDLLKNIFISLILGGYIVLTGIRSSVLRAGLLSIFFLWGRFFKREADIFNILGITAIINLLINPYSLFQVGFQLTYLVLLMILLWQPYLKNIFGKALSVSLSAQFGSIPITAYYFNMITPIGIITNLWAIPLTGLVILISFMGLILGFVFPLINHISSKVIRIILMIINKGMEYTAAFPQGHLEIASPELFTVFFLYFILLLAPFLFQKKAVPILKRRNRLARGYFIILLIIIIIFNLYSPPDDKLQIIFFAVGQGDSILIDLPGGKNIIVDGGGLAGRESDQGEQVLIPYLKYKGIKKIDMAVITHFDTDHALGITSLLEKDRVRSLLLPETHADNYLSRKVYNLAEADDIVIYKGKRGDRFQNGEVFLHILHPYLKNNYIEQNRNNNSLVLKLDYRNFHLILTGDLEREGEMRLVKDYADLNCQILKLGHHGSNSSSSASFLEKVAPKEGIVSVGENNYGHPAKEVMDRLKQAGIREWVTEKSGAIIVRTDGYNYKIRGFCEER